MCALLDLPVKFLLLQLKKIFQMSFTMQRTVEKGRGFAKKVGVVFIFRARYTHNDVKCPPNCQHLPAPMPMQQSDLSECYNHGTIKIVP